MKLHQSVLTSFFMILERRGNNTNEVKDSVIFFTNQYLIYRYIVIVAKSRGNVMKSHRIQPNLTNFSLWTFL